MIILILCLILNNSITPVFALETPTYYAKILYEQVYFFKSPIDDNSCANVYFELPCTYFVELIENANETFYKAKYLNLYGYVKKESVQTVKEQPNSPFLDNLNFRVYADLSRKLQSEPNISSATSNLLATIPLYSRNLTYLGIIHGESLIDGRTDVWYYCKYSADVDYYGYVYSDFCDEMPEKIPQNTETVEFVANPTFDVEDAKNNIQSLPENNKYTSIVIGVLCVPAIIFVVMLVNGKNFIHKEKFKSKEIIDY